jgi:hypothetical protein
MDLPLILASTRYSNSRRITIYIKLAVQMWTARSKLLNEDELKLSQSCPFNYSNFVHSLKHPPPSPTSYHPALPFTNSNRVAPRLENIFTLVGSPYINERNMNRSFRDCNSSKDSTVTRIHNAIYQSQRPIPDLHVIPPMY